MQAKNSTVRRHVLRGVVTGVLSASVLASSVALAANAAAAAELGAAVIVWQHPPEHPALAQAIWRLLGPRLRGCDRALDPLRRLKKGMERLAVRDADRQVAALLAGMAKTRPLT